MKIPPVAAARFTKYESPDQEKVRRENGGAKATGVLVVVSGSGCIFVSISTIG